MHILVPRVVLQEQKFFLSCCVGVHCGIYKSSYNISNITYVSSPEKDKILRMSFLNYFCSFWIDFLIWLNFKMLMTISSSKVAWLLIEICKNILLRSSDTPINHLLETGIGWLIYDNFKHFWKIKESNDISSLCLIFLDKVVKEKDEIRYPNSQFNWHLSDLRAPIHVWKESLISWS
jgi:hypothetical protein